MRIVLVGAQGRMGQELQNIVATSREFQISGRVDRGGGSVMSLGEVKGKIDVVIDFSVPSGTREAAAWCAARQVPLVSGTTGLTAKDFKQLRVCARRTPIFWAANMSLGMAVFRQAIKCLGPLAGFDVQIEEIHHRQKKDRPSGTALTLQADVETALGKKLPQPISIRAGDVKGTHRVMMFGPGEMLIFEHTAVDRAIFARGALHVAKWLVKKPPGLYSSEEIGS